MSLRAARTHRAAPAFGTATAMNLARLGTRLLAGATALSLAGCVYPYSPPSLPPVTAPAPIAAAPAEARAPVMVLISIDGFRPDYLDRGVSPRLSALARGGATGSMIPSFPSKTFPNHWTLVTGLVPDRHGVVANTMEDVRRPGETFTMASDDPFWWNGAEPLWVTAERAGIPTATMFWPGSNVAWGGVVTKGRNHNLPEGGARPREWHQFAQARTGEQRVDALMDWLRRPMATRPRFLTLYFDTVDTVGHESGPDSPEVNRAVAEVDAQIGRLIDGLAALGQPANLIFVADHGMASTSSTRTIALDRVADPTSYRVLEAGPYAGLFPAPGREAALEAALLRPHPHMTCWRKGAIPARFRYGSHPRVPPYLCLAEVGWTILKTAPAAPFAGGNHGYDHQAPEMRALFVAHGPAFRPGVRLPSFSNTSVAPLLRELLGLPPGQGLDGDATPFRKAMR
jgi:predicted AlkP superfamily pyrophosphatase or phosphodiesterase